MYIDESEAQDARIMQYQRLLSAGKINEDEELKAKDFLQAVQMVLKPIKVVNPYAMHLSLTKSVFKPRRTNAHYLQFIAAITFYKQYQREHKTDEITGEIYIETTIEDIKEANELIIEVLLRKSDTLSGACRNHLERLKQYLASVNQTTFTNTEIRRNLRVKQTTLQRYNAQLLMEGYIRKTKGKKGQTYHFEIVDVNEYRDLRKRIDDSLATCLAQIHLPA